MKVADDLYIAILVVLSLAPGTISTISRAVPFRNVKSPFAIFGDSQ